MMWLYRFLQSARFPVQKQASYDAVTRVVPEHRAYVEVLLGDIHGSRSLHELRENVH